MFTKISDLLKKIATGFIVILTKISVKSLKNMALGFVVLSFISLVAGISYQIFDNTKPDLNKELLKQDKEIENLTKKLFEKYRKDSADKDADFEFFLESIELDPNRSTTIKQLKDRVDTERDILGSVFGALLLLGLILFTSTLLIVSKRNQDKKDSIDATAHQLRRLVYPLHLILKNLSTINLSKEKHTKSINLAVERADELINLTEQINQLFSKKSIERESISVEAMVKEIIKQFKETNSKEIEFSDSIKIDKPILGDKTLVCELIRNLIDNAIGFSHIKGKIFVKAFKQGNFAVLEVIDQGVGLKNKENVLSHGAIQPSPRTDERKTGHGLGLKIVKKIIRLHHGEFSGINNNKNGKGVTATVKFPS